jgi:predicted ABC-type ATPase
VKPQLVFLAGPNGAGKSTYYNDYLRDSQLPFLNADVVEAKTGISSLEIARVLDGLRDDFLEQGVGFITETVFSDPVGSKLGFLKKAVDAGYDVTLIYIGVEPELSALRVDERVAFGGHDVPRDRIASRFERSLANLREAIVFVPVVKIYDNSSPEAPYRQVAIFEAGKQTFAADDLPRWLKPIVKTSRRSRPSKASPRSGRAGGARKTRPK